MCFVAQVCFVQSLEMKQIISTGQITPPNEWYNQEEDEWVMILSGKGVIECIIENKEKFRTNEKNRNDSPNEQNTPNEKNEQNTPDTPNEQNRNDSPNEKNTPNDPNDPDDPNDPNPQNRNDSLLLTLLPGDFTFIPKFVKHRVVYTMDPTIWLAIHIFYKDS